MSKTYQLSTILSKSARLSTFLSAQKSKFTLKSPFLSGFTLLSAFLSTQKSAQATSQPLCFFILIFLSFLKVPFPLEMCLSFYLSHLSDVLVMSNTSLFFVKVCQRNWKNMVDADIVISSAHLASQDLREFYISDLCYFKISNFCKI